MRATAATKSRRARTSVRRRPPAQKAQRTITVGVNDDIDWTPPDQQIFARTVVVEDGTLCVRIEEARYGDGRFLFCVGLGTPKRLPKEGYSLAWMELLPNEFDSLVELLTVVRDKARELGMPSLKRGPEVRS